LEVFASDRIENTLVYPSLGRYMYHGLLALAQHNSFRVACVGNSSSGIKETPAFGCPTVNIGSRQKGRLRGVNVIDVDYNGSEIYNAIRKCLQDQSFREICRAGENPYGVGDVGKKIADILTRQPYDLHKLLTKSWVFNQLESI